MGKNVGMQHLRLNPKRISEETVIACRKNTILFIFLIFVIGFWGLGKEAHGQEYPTRSITLLIGNPPGSGTDTCSRLIAQYAATAFGQEITPVNKAGAQGAVAAGIAAGAKGDGYTLLAVTSPTFTNVPHLKMTTFDPVKDFVPIIQFGFLANAVIVRSDSPYKSLDDLIDAARKDPKKISFAVPGIGSSSHLAAEHVMQEKNVKYAIIAFEGGLPSVAALMGGHVSAVVVGTSAFLSHLKAGQVRVLAATTDKRIEVIKDAPTLLELGYPYGAFNDVYVIAAPKGIPPAVLKRLEDTFRKAMKTQEFRSAAENFFMYVENPLSGQDLKDVLKKQYERNGAIIRKGKIGEK
jgi:tripartite-type tricarboxylate transporter receptor subunit TctC